MFGLYEFILFSMHPCNALYSTVIWLWYTMLMPDFNRFVILFHHFLFAIALLKYGTALTKSLFSKLTYEFAQQILFCDCLFMVKQTVYITLYTHFFSQDSLCSSETYYGWCCIEPKDALMKCHESHTRHRRPALVSNDRANRNVHKTTMHSP